MAVEPFIPLSYRVTPPELKADIDEMEKFKKIVDQGIDVIVATDEPVTTDKVSWSLSEGGQNMRDLANSIDEIAQVEVFAVESPHEVFSAQAEIVDSIRDHIGVVTKEMEAWKAEVLANPSEEDRKAIAKAAERAKKSIFQMVSEDFPSGLPTSPMPLSDNENTIKDREAIRRFADIVENGLDAAIAESLAPIKQDNDPTAQLPVDMPAAPDATTMLAEIESAAHAKIFNEDMRNGMERIFKCVTGVDGILDEQQTALATISALLATNAEKVEASARRTRFVIAASAILLVAAKAMFAFVTFS